MKEKVLAILKTKVKALGFSKKELESAAANIASNLTLEENASEEDIAEAISKEVDSVVPYLKLSQSAASRAIQAYKDAHADVEEEEDTNRQQQSKETKKEEDTPTWAKALIEQNNVLTEKVIALEGSKVADTRRARLEGIVKDTGLFGERVLKNFSRMKFDTPEEFDSFCEEVTEDLKAENQERANQGLSKLGTRPNAGSQGEKKADEIKEIDESTIQSIVDSF